VPGRVDHLHVEFASEISKLRAPLLNLLQHSLVLPTRDAPLGTGRALSLERALRWRCRDRLMRRFALLGHIVATDACLLNLSPSKA
jgi:hypothetical protein